MPVTTTQKFAADAHGLAAASAILAAGGLVAFPTETVYGLGGDARNDHAVARIFEAKGRPRFNPLIVHVPDLAAARELARFDDQAERLAGAFWPGPLTLVLPLRAKAGLSRLVTAGLDRVALRVPDHPTARALLVRSGRALAAPSANPSGRISPTCATHVMAGLAGRIEAVLDGGACPVGLESTIVGWRQDAPHILRPGGLPVEAIEACLGEALTGAQTGALSGTPTEPPPERPDAPGQLASHYAPRAALRLNVRMPRPDELWIGFGGDCAGAELNLSTSGDLVEAAANLFAHLHHADAIARTTRSLAVAPVPEHGLGRAINDRLRRAAAPRPAPSR